MTAIEEYTYKLLEKHNIRKGSKDEKFYRRAQTIIDDTIIPSQVQNAYKAAEVYLGLKGGEDEEPCG